MKLCKKIICTLLLVFALLGLVGCGAGVDDGTHKVINKDETINIGILQVATHGALDDSRAGFIEALKDAGFENGKNIKINYLNAEGDKNNMQMMAKTLVRENDLVLAIATDAAKAIKVASRNEGKRIPILFTAVTDAVDAKLVASNENVGGRVTGTSDINPVDKQIGLIKQMNSELKTLGILYTISETNSKVQAEMAKAQAQKDNLKVIEGSVAKAADILQATEDIISKGADVIYIPTDNNLAKNMGIIESVCNQKQVPVVCGEKASVQTGGLITYGINYKKLGELTGEMAVEIINGAQAKDLPVKTLPEDKCELFINMDNLAKMKFEMPKTILDKAEKYSKNSK